MLLSNTDFSFHRLFDSEQFSDVVIQCEPVLKRVHNCVLTARVPNLFKELRDNFRCKARETSAEVVYIRVTPLACESAVLNQLLRKVYTDNDIRKEEVSSAPTLSIVKYK